MANHVRYTYIRHPVNTRWVITIARQWADAEKTKLYVTWCANKSEAGYGMPFDRGSVMDAFDRKKAHQACDGRLKSERTRHVLELPEPYERGKSASLVERVILFVHQHPELPTALRRLISAAMIADFKTLPFPEFTELEYVKYLKWRADNK